MTGDLIDYTLADLPAGLDFVKRLDPCFGLFTIEGNHDLFESRGGFEQGVAAAGVPLLLNDSRIVRVRGCDVQILGIRWGGDFRAVAPISPITRGQPSPFANPTPFPILLSHHPHAFDPAADAGIPLTLAGHTHGGQLMLTETLGAGSVMFKYWSGLYRQKESAGRLQRRRQLVPPAHQRAGGGRAHHAAEGMTWLSADIAPGSRPTARIGRSTGVGATPSG